MDALTFGPKAVILMLLCNANETRGRGWVLGFAGSRALGSAYGYQQGAWLFGVVEAIWAEVALRRWQRA